MMGEGQAGGGAPTTRRAVVGYDGSAHAREALSYAATVVVVPLGSTTKPGPS